jgi:hypothetical protein
MKCSEMRDFEAKNKKGSREASQSRRVARKRKEQSREGGSAAVYQAN